MLRNSPSFDCDHPPPLIASIDMLLGCNSDEGMSEALGAQVVVDDTTVFVLHSHNSAGLQRQHARRSSGTLA
jgi:hypothetical protein